MRQGYLARGDGAMSILPNGSVIDLARVNVRVFNDLRVRIDQMISDGWSVTGRDPVRLERGVQIKIVRGRALING